MSVPPSVKLLGLLYKTIILIRCRKNFYIRRHTFYFALLKLISLPRILRIARTVKETIIHMGVCRQFFKPGITDGLVVSIQFGHPTTHHGDKDLHAPARNASMSCMGHFIMP